jgi:hypothetical protein
MVVLDKVAEGGAHPKRLSSMRWREGASAVVLVNGDRAPVDSGGRR